MKKAISLILSLLMLVTMFIPVGAASEIIDPEVVNSITEEDETGLGVAFLYTMNMQNATIKDGTIRTFVGAEANGKTVVKLGAIVTNQMETGQNPEAMVIENANGIKLLNVEATKLWNWDETYLAYAVRITNIPTENNKTSLYARPYYILEDGEVVYGAVTYKSYFGGQCDNAPITLPDNGTDIDISKKKNRIRVSATSQMVSEEGNRQVSLTFTNYTSNWITEETDYVKYRCYDAAGKTLETKTIYIGCIDTKKNKTKTFTFTVPDATAKVKLISSKITYWTEWA